jgi:hypothetical protein
MVLCKTATIYLSTYEKGGKEFGKTAASLRMIFE